MKMIISNNSSVPIYEQIKNSIIEQIMNGELKENESIPSIRSLAADIRISVMTIKKAYNELESEGYIETVQGKGSFVASRTHELALEQAKREIEEYLLKSIKLARKVNIRNDELKDLFDYFMESE